MLDNPAMTRTTTALLDGLADPADQRVWQEFDARFRPVVAGFAMRLGVREHDAADVAQETLVSFATSYREGAYERSRGRLRSWLLGIARNRIRDHVRRHGARRENADDGVLDTLADEDHLQKLWDVEAREAMVRHAMDELRTATNLHEDTLRAFELMAVHRRSAASVAGELGMTTGDVYAAKKRAAARLREILTRLGELYAEDEV